MASVQPPLAVRAGVAAAATEEGAAADEQRAPQQETEQQAQRQRRGKEAKPPPPPRPTHFLALQVSQHPSVTAAITTVQAAVTRHSPHLKKACVDAASTHLTLGVMALNSPEERARAADVLARLAEPLRQAALLAPVRAQLEGLSHFRNQVLYLDMRPDDGLEQLMALAAATRAHFKDAGLLLQADQPFVPHVTIAKTSKLQGWGKKGPGRGAGGKRHGVSHGGKNERHDWRVDRREERGAKQQRLEMQAADEEALASMGWGRGGEAGNGASSGTVGVALAAAEQPTEGGTAEQAGALASASAAVLPACATEAPSSSHANNIAFVVAAAGEADREAKEEAAQQKNVGLEAGQQAQLGSRGGQQAGEGAAGQPAHRSCSSWRQIDAEAWAQHATIVGGSVLLVELQLCAMQGRKPEGYYPVLCSLPLCPAQASTERGAEQAAAAGNVQEAGVEEAAAGRPDGGQQDAEPAVGGAGVRSGAAEAAPQCP